jgi:hypothetical protein
VVEAETETGTEEEEEEELQVGYEKRLPPAGTYRLMSCWSLARDF